MTNCKNCKHKNDMNIIEHLQLEMEKNKYVSKNAVIEISKKLNVSESEIYGVLTFYSQFLTSPKAKHVIEVCTGTACHILGADLLIKTIESNLKLKANETTTDGQFKLGTIRCLGCCSLAPVMRIDGKIYEKVEPKNIAQILEEYKEN